MPTRSQIVDDLELRLYASKPSDDIHFSKSQASFLVDNVRDEILTEKFEEQIKKGDQLEPFYYTRETGKTLSKEAITGGDDEFSDFRYSFSLDNDVLPLSKDKGLVMVRDNYGRILAHATENEQDFLSKLPYGGFDTKCQVFYRENRNIFIESSIPSSSSVYTYSVTYIPMGNSAGDDDPYPLEDQLVPELTDRVEQILRRQMQIGLGDTENDGTDPYHDAQPQQ